MKSSFPILLLALCEPARAIALGGVVTRLKLEIPHAQITLVTTLASAELFSDETVIGEILAFDGAIFNLKMLGALAELSRRPWGLLVDIGPSMLSRMIRSRTRFVVNAQASEGPLRQICHALDLDLVEAAPRLTMAPARDAKASAVLEAGRMSKPFLVMAPGAGWLGRRWPTERYAVLATRLMRDDGPFAHHNLLILGDEADRDTAVALAMATPRAQVMEMTGKLDLLTACAVLKNAAAFVGNDEIWLRLAAAAGIPTFGLFGPSDEADAPPGANMHAIRGPRSLDTIRAADPKLKQSVCHMLDLTIDTVYDAIEMRTPKVVPEPELELCPEAEPEPDVVVEGVVETVTQVDVVADDSDVTDVVIDADFEDIKDVEAQDNSVREPAHAQVV